MKIKGREIKSECKNCGEILQCELFLDGHGIGRERKRITELVQCQIDHKRRRTQDGA